MVRLLIFVLVVSAANVASASGIIPLSQTRSVTTHAEATQYYSHETPTDASRCYSDTFPVTATDDHSSESHDFGAFDSEQTANAHEGWASAAAVASLTSTSIGPHYIQLDVAANTIGASPNECTYPRANSSVQFDIAFRVDEPGEYTATFLTPEYYRGIGLNFPSPVATLSNASGNVIFDTSHFEWLWWEDVPIPGLAHDSLYDSIYNSLYNWKSSTFTLTPGVYSLTGGIAIESRPIWVWNDIDAPDATTYRFTLTHTLPEPSTWAMLAGAALCGASNVIRRWPHVIRRRRMRGAVDRAV